MTFNEMSKEFNLPAPRNAEYVYGKFNEWYVKSTRECGLAGNPSVFQPTFYWWCNLDAKVAALPFAFAPGDLAVHDKEYVIVVGRMTVNPRHQTHTMFNERTMRYESMKCMDWSLYIQVKNSNGQLKNIHCTALKFAYIPQEIFKLACNKASTCPMMGGKENA